MKKNGYTSLNEKFSLTRRQFIASGSIAGAGIILGRPTPGFGQTIKPATNVKEILEVPRTTLSLPGLFPGRVVQVSDSAVQNGGEVEAETAGHMFLKGLENLAGVSPRAFHRKLFTKNDIIGIKVNPVGAGLISTHMEIVDAVVSWLTANGTPRRNIVIWDRFDYMLRDAGFTPERYPGIRIEGLQTMDEAAAEGRSDDNSSWLDKQGKHISTNKFDQEVSYWADVDAPQEDAYLNQHVFNGKHSYFGKLLTTELTKIINIPVFKNTGNGISMATKNIAYAAVCNTGRLHRPLFFDVCTEVLAFPVIRDKLVLNITDGIRGQYDGGPGAAAQFIYNYNTIFFATDPFALDMTCHNILLKKRRDMGIKVNEHPRYTDYLHYAQRLNLGIGDASKIELIEV